MKHTLQDEWFPSDYEVLVRGRSRVQAALRHRSQDEFFQKVYETPVRRRVISKWTRGTAHTTIGFQVATRHRSKDELLPSAYEAPVTGRVVSKLRRDTSHRMISQVVTRQVVTRYRLQDELFPRVKRRRSEDECFPSGYEWLPSGYEAPVTGRVVSKWWRDNSFNMCLLRDTGHRTSGFQMVMRHRSQDGRFPSGYEALVKGRNRSKCVRGTRHRSRFNRIRVRHTNRFRY